MTTNEDVEAARQRIEEKREALAAARVKADDIVRSAEASVELAALALEESVLDAQIAEAEAIRAYDRSAFDAPSSVEVPAALAVAAPPAPSDPPADPDAAPAAKLPKE